MTHNPLPPVRVELRRARLDSQGYAHSGRDYYGTGAPVWEYLAHVPYQDHQTGEWDTREKYGAVRAPDLAAAKVKLRALWPDATFGAERKVKSKGDTSSQYSRTASFKDALIDVEGQFRRKRKAAPDSDEWREALRSSARMNADARKIGKREGMSDSDVHHAILQAELKADHD